MINRWLTYHPVAAFDTLVDGVFDDMLDVVRGSGGESADGGGSGPAAVQMPVDIQSSDSSYKVMASLPGFSPEQVEITVDGGLLNIRANRQGESVQEGAQWVRRERWSGSLQRRIQLPKDVDSGNIEASFSNGVLTVTIPRMVSAQPRKIAIQAGGNHQLQG